MKKAEPLPKPITVKIDKEPKNKNEKKLLNYIKKSGPVTKYPGQL